MDKIATPQELCSELHQLLAYSQTRNPSRARIARTLRSMADRVAFLDAPEVLLGAGDTPDEVRQLAKVVYNHRLEDPSFLKNIEKLGWKKIREVPYSGAWWVAKGDLEAMITFGGPKKDAKVFSWRVNGGPATTL